MLTAALAPVCPPTHVMHFHCCTYAAHHPCSTLRMSQTSISHQIATVLLACSCPLGTEDSSLVMPLAAEISAVAATTA